MGRTTKNMKHSFGGFPPFSGKDPLKVFSWLRKLVKACNDNDVSEGMALYAVPHFLSGDEELRCTRELPDSGTALGVARITSYPVAVNWFLQTYAEPHTLALAQDTFIRAIIEPDETLRVHFGPLARPDGPVWEHPYERDHEAATNSRTNGLHPDGRVCLQHAGLLVPAGNDLCVGQA